MNQPPSLFLFAFTQLWESFSYYGMRALLVLYLISSLKYAEGDAFAIYALYTCLVEFGAFFGGYCADRYIGLGSAVVLGGVLICIGHILLTFAESGSLFFYGLSAIVCGAMLFRSNLKALVGSIYAESDPRREAGFTLFYIGVNLGGFVATLVCGYVAGQYGWHAGFGLASIGMLFGMGVFLLCYPIMKTIPPKGQLKSLALSIPLIILGCSAVAYLLEHFQMGQVLLMPAGILLFSGLMRMLWKEMPKDHAITMLGLLGLLMIYFTFEELMGSLLMVFSENHVDRNFLGWEIPSAMLSATNPLIIIGCGPFLSVILQKRQVSLPLRMAIAFFCLAGAFAILFLVEAVTMMQLIFSFAFIALGELFLAPSVYAYCSLVSPANHKGLTMGVVTLAFALASLLSGQVSQLASQGGEGSVQSLFLMIAILSSILFTLLFWISKKRLKIA